MPATTLDRIATDAATAQDEQKVNTISRFAPNVFQGEMVVKMPYNVYFTKSVTVGVGAPHQFLLNSIFDPDLTGSGGQPLGRDTWCAIYDYYKVLQCNVKITVIEQTNDSTGAQTANQYPSLHGIMMDISANPPSSTNTWLNAVGAGGAMNAQQWFSEVKTYDIINGRGQQPLIFEKTWVPDMFDTAIINDATMNTWTPVGANPTNLNFLSLVAYNPNTLSATRLTTYKVELEYVVAFKSINRSLLHTAN